MSQTIKTVKRVVHSRGYRGIKFWISLVAWALIIIAVFSIGYR